MRKCISRYFLTFGLITIGTMIVLFLQLQWAEQSQSAGQNSNNQPNMKVEISERSPAVTVGSEVSEEETFESLMRERREVMRAACQQEGLDKAGEDDLHRINPWEYLINKRYNVVWCNVFKSASSSWMFIFNLLAGYSEQFLETSRAVPLQLARDKYPRPSVDELSRALSRSNVTSIIIGRDPLERLVSAYRDKIHGALPGTLHDKLRRRITRDYRGVPVPKTRRLPEKFIPTFREFVEYLVVEFSKGKVPDMHWAPVYSFCHPCQVNLNSIVKFETLDEDTHNILKKIHAPDKLTKVKKKNQTKGKKSSNFVLQYLKQLDKALYENLINIYRIDFNIFGYSIPHFESL